VVGALSLQWWEHNPYSGGSTTLTEVGALPLQRWEHYPYSRYEVKVKHSHYSPEGLGG
jgi:hypothetical protein